MKGNLFSNLKKYTSPFVTKKREIFFFYVFIIVIDFFLRLYYWYYLNDPIPSSAFFLNYFLVLLLVMASLVVIGVSATLQVEKMMYTDSELQPAESLPDPNLVEVPATISPKFVMADGRIVQNKDVQAIRKLITKRGRSIFLLTILRDLIVGAGYFYIPLLTAKAFDQFTYDQYYGYLNLDWLIWFFAALRLLYHSRQFNPLKTSFDSIGSILLLPFRILSTPWLQPVIFAVIVFPALIDSVSALISSGDYYELIASLLPLIFHLSLIVFLRRKSVV